MVSVRHLTIPALLLALIPGSADGQDALDRLRDLARENAESYADPLTRGLAEALAGGYADRATPLSRLGFDIGFRFLGARPTETEATFHAVLPDWFEYGGRTYEDPFRPLDGSTETPTIAGNGSGIVLVPSAELEEDIRAAGEDPDAYRIRFPDGLSLPAVPTAVVHASLGIGFGTDVSINFLPAVEVTPEIGETRSRGVSARHALSHWFTSPLALTVTAGYQEATAGEYLEASAWHYGLLAGIQAGPMSFFGGAQAREASTRITYRLDHPLLGASEVDFSTRADTDPAYLVGARLQLLAMNLSGHYAFGAHDIFSLKLGFGIP